MNRVNDAKRQIRKYWMMNDNEGTAPVVKRMGEGIGSLEVFVNDAAPAKVEVFRSHLLIGEQWFQTDVLRVAVAHDLWRVLGLAAE